MSSGVIAPALPPTLPLDFALDDAHIAHQPAEQRCGSRADVRLMVSPGPDQPVHAAFADLAELLAPGDLVVVNNSSTVPAAADAVLDDDRRIVLHASTELPGGLWMVEPRQPVAGGATETLRLDGGPVTAHLVDGTLVELLRPAPGSRRLWLAVMGGDADLVAALGRTGRPIRYGYIPHDYPLESYQTVFAVEAGSAEMPSAARPFTPEIVTSLVRRGVGVAAITLHTGVSSLEGHELPYPERYHVPASTAAVVNTTRRSGGHVIAVGTTVVRALESAVDGSGTVHPASGWTDVVVTPARGVRAVDGLLTGWHEPAATHLAMLEAVAGREALVNAYRSAWDAGYRWHEFGDSHLLVPYAGRRWR